MKSKIVYNLSENGFSYTVSREYTCDIPALDIEDLNLGSGYAKEVLNTITDNIISGKAFKEKISLYKEKQDSKEKENQQLINILGKPFEDKEKLEKQKALVAEYREKMNEEILQAQQEQERIMQNSNEEVQDVDINDLIIDDDEDEDTEEEEDNEYSIEEEDVARDEYAKISRQIFSYPNKVDRNIVFTDNNFYLCENIDDENGTFDIVLQLQIDGNEDLIKKIQELYKQYGKNFTSYLGTEDYRNLNERFRSIGKAMYIYDFGTKRRPEFVGESDALVIQGETNSTRDIKSSNRLYQDNEEKSLNNLTQQAKNVGLTDKQIEDMIEYSIAWHSSPYKFRKFNIGKKGLSGEGAMVHGYGNYVAVAKETGDRYATGFQKNAYKGVYINEYIAKNKKDKEKCFVIKDIARQMQYKSLFKAVKDSVWNNLIYLSHYDEERKREKLSRNFNFSKASEFLFTDIKEEDFNTTAPAYLYKVEIPDNEKGTYVEEERKLPANVYRKLAMKLSKLEGTNKYLPVILQEYKDKEFSYILRNLPDYIADEQNKGLKIISDILQDAGYKGIHYEGARDGECYVIFKDEDIKILERTDYNNDDVDYSISTDEQDKQGNPIDANGNLVLEDANVSSGKSQTTDTGEFSTEDDIEFSIDKDELYNNVPYDMPIEFVKEIKSWDIINRSPYSFSFYNANGISWEGKPDKSLRIADHWNFYSKGSTHCVTDTEPEPNSWTLAKYHDKTKTYEILKSIPKADLAHSIINAFYYNNIQEDPVDIINKIYNVVLELDKLGTLSDVINREIKINTNAIEDALLRRDNGKNISNKIDISQYNSYLDYIKTLDDKRAKTITLLFENNFDFNKEYTYKLPIKKLPPVDNYFRSKYLDKDDNEVIKNFLTINNSNYTFIDNYRPVSREKIDSFIKDINDAKKDIPELQKIGNEKSSEKAPQDLTTSIVALSSKDFAKLQQIIQNLKDYSKNLQNNKSTKYFITSLSKILGIKEAEEDRSIHSASFRKTLTLANGKKVSFRISNHNANADTYLKFGNSEIGNQSIVIKSRRQGNTFKDNDNVNLKEFVYFKEDIQNSDKNILSQIVSSIAKALENDGIYKDETGIAIINQSPNPITNDTEFSIDSDIPSENTTNVFARGFRNLVAWGKDKLGALRSSVDEWTNIAA